MKPITPEELETFRELEDKLKERANFVFQKHLEIKYEGQRRNPATVDRIHKISKTTIVYEVDNGRCSGDTTFEYVPFEDLFSDDFIQVMKDGVARKKEEERIRNEELQKKQADQRIANEKAQLAELLKKYPKFTLEDL